MSLNCDNLESIYRGCVNPIGGIDQRIYINDSENITSLGVSASTHTINSVGVTMSNFETIEFRKNLATFEEPYTRNDDGAIIFTPTLTIPIHGRDAAKSRQISLIAAGQREVDIIIPNNDGTYVYFRKMQLQSVADGQGANKADASKYTLVFDGQSEQLSYFVNASVIPGII
jgi:hypothetical protein